MEVVTASATQLMVARFTGVPEDELVMLNGVHMLRRKRRCDEADGVAREVIGIGGSGDDVRSRRGEDGDLEGASARQRRAIARDAARDSRIGWRRDETRDSLRRARHAISDEFGRDDGGDGGEGGEGGWDRVGVG